MNAVNARSVIRELSRVGWLTQRAAHAALQAPVFEIPPAQVLTPDEIEFVTCHGYAFRDQRVILAPFPWLLVDAGPVTWLFDLSQYGSVRHWVIQSNRREYYVADLPQGQGTESPSYEFRMRVDGRERDDASLAFWLEEARRGDGYNLIFETPRAALWHLIAALVLPGSVVLRVSPNRSNKSVEWNKAREHFLIVPRRMANSLQRSKLALTDAQVHRAAHWRRSHLRRLRSPKFTRLCGRVVPVRAAWVGPVEWIGSDKKIYRVLAVDGEALNSSA